VNARAFQNAPKMRNIREDYEKQMKNNEKMMLKVE
jgi:hypothetical protein